MKRILLFVIVFATLGAKELKAQCSIEQSSIKISNIINTPNGGNCDVQFTLEFDIAGNGGNKWSFVHIWNANAAPSPAINWNSKPNPNLAMLQDGAGASVATLLKTIALDYSSNINVAIPRNYFPANSDVNGTVQYTGITATKSAGHFKIDGIKITGIPCGTQFNVKADVWSAQDQNGKNVACGTAGLSFIANDPVLRANAVCGDKFSFSVRTTETRNIVYTAYSDANGNGVIDATDTVPANVLKNAADVPYSNVTITNPASSDPTSFTDYGPFTYKPAGGNGVIIVAQGIGVINRSLLTIPYLECIVTPVLFKGFTADRKNSTSVSLKWTTASEQNNKGFYVQRNVGGEWKNVAFVFSAADGGNSSSDLSYALNDVNAEKGISQYRILQVDIDGKASYSEIRAIRGESIISKISVYPNPSTDGKVNVVFESASVRDVLVNDLQGRLIKRFAGVSGNVLIIDNLKKGFYTIKITDRNTAASAVEKVVVN